MLLDRWPRREISFLYTSPLTMVDYSMQQLTQLTQLAHILFSNCPQRNVLPLSESSINQIMTNFHFNYVQLCI